ncbi:OsmY domain-containing protein [Xenophilus aerolatus]|nr:OsmY domain-containing protein [Xenophilus aerolatus]
MKSGTQIRDDVLAELRWDPAVNETDVGVIVKAGNVTLTGHLSSFAEEYAAELTVQRVVGVRRAAEGAVRNLLGVTGVTNLITLKPRVKADAIEGRIREALERRADREARRIEVGVAGTAVTLRGKVHTLAERQAAQGAAWSAPGVTRVVNDILVEA